MRGCVAVGHATAKQSINILWPFDDQPQFCFEDLIAEELLCNAVIVIDHLLAERGIVQYMVGLLDRFVAEKSVERNRAKSARFDVCAVNQVTVADNRAAMIDRFQMVGDR